MVLNTGTFVNVYNLFTSLHDYNLHQVLRPLSIENETQCTAAISSSYVFWLPLLWREVRAGSACLVLATKDDLL